MSMTSVLYPLRRRRAIASLYKHRAATRPFWRRPRPDWADDPDQVALAQLESFFWREERRQPAW
jgi:hypothetical protein